MPRADAGSSFASLRFSEDIPGCGNFHDVELATAGASAALNREALELLRCPRELAIIPGATHLFGEPGTLEEVARVASTWFVRYLGPRALEAA
jgi:hypothetical protein